LIQTWILSAFWSSQKGAGLSETNVYPIPSHGCTKANYPYQNGHKLRVNPTPTSFWQISLRYYPSNYWNLPPFIVCHYPGPLYPFSTSEEKKPALGTARVCSSWSMGSWTKICAYIAKMQPGEPRRLQRDGDRRFSAWKKAPLRMWC
jgi:hypothetical protein